MFLAISASQKSSPRPWGCFFIFPCCKSFAEVFPTPVGVFPRYIEVIKAHFGLPHARGGVSSGKSTVAMPRRSSPRPWGCFSPQYCKSDLTFVFPTPVGVFLSPGKKTKQPVGLPHARGGVSATSTNDVLAVESSPRPWGCFFLAGKKATGTLVFPTPVGVFLRANRPWQCREGLPHARGGVSFKWSAASRSCASSPRPWGCFSPVQMDYKKHRVFPTPVGVFPDVQAQLASIGGLPHARGGVSSCKSVGFQPNTSSPRTWGCFSLLILKRTKNLVFPTPDIGKSALRLPISGKSFCQTTLFF